MVSPISHFSANASGETSFRLVDEIGIFFTCSSNYDMKASILTWGLVVGVVVFGKSSIYSGLAFGVFVFGLGGRGTLALRTSQLGFFLVIISPFQLFIAISC